MKEWVERLVWVLFLLPGCGGEDEGALEVSPTKDIQQENSSGGGSDGEPIAGSGDFCESCTSDNSCSEGLVCVATAQVGDICTQKCVLS